MSEIIVNMQGYGSFRMVLDLVDPASEYDSTEVWKASFCDDESNDCQIVYFEMGDDYEAWDLLDEAIQTYRREFDLVENPD